jgi:hypothetical protein
MHPGLDLLAAAQPGCFTTADADAVGLHKRDLARLISSGVCRRMRRGLYALAAGWPSTPAEQHVALTAALLDRPDGRHAASHHSAALMHGLPVWGCPLDEVHLVPLASARRGRGNGLMVHGPLPDAAIVHGPSGALVRPAVAALQIAMRFGVEAGIVSLDAGLRDSLFGPAEIHRALQLLQGKLHYRWAERAAAAADQRSESVGESRLRFRLRLLRFDGFQPQVEIRSGGRLIGRVDLYDAASRTVIEFDGLIKYRGNDGSEQLIREKRREDRLRALDLGVARFVWHELDNLTYLKSETRRAMGQGRPGGRD